MDTTRDSAQETKHEASHVIAYIVIHRKTPNIIVTIIDTFSAGNSCMSIIGNLRCIATGFVTRLLVIAR